MNRKSEAVELFKQTYGNSPKNLGFPAIAMYEKQSAFLYATSDEVIRAYKTQQNILRWFMSWFMWPAPIALIAWIVAMVRYHDFLYPACLAIATFGLVYITLFVVLAVRVWLTTRLVKIGRTVTFLNY